MQVFGQCVVWSQLNYEARNQLFSWSDRKQNPFDSIKTFLLLWIQMDNESPKSQEPPKKLKSNQSVPIYQTLYIRNIWYHDSLTQLFDKKWYFYFFLGWLTDTELVTGVNSAGYFDNIGLTVGSPASLNQWRKPVQLSAAAVYLMEIF